MFDRRFTEAENDEEALRIVLQRLRHAGHRRQYVRLSAFARRIDRAAGYSFCSASAAALAAGEVKTDDYFFMDVIFGKQRSVEMGRGTSRRRVPRLSRGVAACTRRVHRFGSFALRVGQFHRHRSVAVACVDG